MKYLRLLSVLLLTFVLCSPELLAKPGKKSKNGSLKSGRQESDSGIRHSILICGAKSTALFDEDSKVIWQASEGSRDGYVLPNGNILYSNQKMAKEVTVKGELVWSYQISEENSLKKKGEVGTVQRLPDGNTLVVERGPVPQLVEVDSKGQAIHKVPLQPETNVIHRQTRMARKLSNGNYLVSHLVAFKIKEYDRSGKILRTIPTDLKELGGRKPENWPFAAVLLANGRIMSTLTRGNKVVEFDANGKVVWRVDNKDVGGHFNTPCGGQRLPNGNTVVANYGERKAKRKKVVEFDSQGKLVWAFYHPTMKVHSIHIASTNGKKIEGTPLK